MRSPQPPDSGPALPRVARGDPAAGARAIADLIPAAVNMAEALGAAEIAGHLRMALSVAERRAASASRKGSQ